MTGVRVTIERNGANWRFTYPDTGEIQEAACLAPLLANLRGQARLDLFDVTTPEPILSLALEAVAELSEQFPRKSGDYDGPYSRRSDDQT